jgi:hypothetical protein
MPAPIVLPMMTASPNPMPRTRSNRPGLADLTGVAWSTGRRGTPPLKTGNESHDYGNDGKSSGLLTCVLLAIRTGKNPRESVKICVIGGLVSSKESFYECRVDH